MSTTQEPVAHDIQSLMSLADRYAGALRSDALAHLRDGKYPEVNEVGPARMALQNALTTALYLHPRQPLSEERIIELVRTAFDAMPDGTNFNVAVARAIEREHGIGSKE